MKIQKDNNGKYSNEGAAKALRIMLIMEHNNRHILNKNLKSNDDDTPKYKSM